MLEMPVREVMLRHPSDVERVPWMAASILRSDFQVAALVRLVTVVRATDQNSSKKRHRSDFRSSAAATSEVIGRESEDHGGFLSSMGRLTLHLIPLSLIH